MSTIEYEDLSEDAQATDRPDDFTPPDTARYFRRAIDRAPDDVPFNLYMAKSVRSTLMSEKAEVASGGLTAMLFGEDPESPDVDERNIEDRIVQLSARRFIHAAGLARTYDVPPEFVHAFVWEGRDKVERWIDFQSSDDVVIVDPENGEPLCEGKVWEGLVRDGAGVADVDHADYYARYLAGSMVSRSYSAIVTVLDPEKPEFEAWHEDDLDAVDPTSMVHECSDVHATDLGPHV